MKSIVYFNKTIALVLFYFFLIWTNGYAQHVWTRTNPGGGGALSMVAATKSGLIVAGGDLSGVYTTNDNGNSWNVYGNQNGLNNTQVTCFGFHPTNGQTFIAGTGIGAYKTTNGGQNFHKVQFELSPNHGIGYVESIGMAMSDANIGYMAHYENWLPELSFLKTIDAGENWTRVSFNGLPATARIIKIMVDDNNASIIYALAGKGRFRCSDPYLFRSTDSGLNWTRVGASIGDVLDFDLHATNTTDPSELYVSTFQMNANGCASEMWLYASGPGKLFKSINSGADFTIINNSMSGIISVGTDPQNISLVDITSGTGNWKTTNGGNSWNNTGPRSSWYKGWARNDWAYVIGFYGYAKTVTKDRFNPNKLYAVFGQWAWSSTDGGDHINNISTKEITTDHFRSTGLANVEGNSIDVNDSDPNSIYLGAYDIGFWYSKDHGVSWKKSYPDKATYPNYTWWDAGGTNCNFVLSDPANPDKVWAAFAKSQPTIKSAIFKSTNSGEAWAISNTGLNDFGLLTHGLSIDINSDVNNRTLFVTQEGDVWKSVDDGTTWAKVFTDGGLKFTEVDKFDGQLVYAGGENGFFRSTDGGTNWTEVGLPEMHFSTSVQNAVMRPDIIPEFGDFPLVPWGGVFEVKADPNVANRVYVVVHGEGKGLFRSNDGGMTWTKLYTNDKMRGVAIAPENSDILYTSSSTNYHSGAQTNASIGILVSYDAGTTWSFANDGMGWSNGGRMEVESGNNPNVWVWVPGTGLQYAPVPNFVLPVEMLTPFSAKVRNGHVLLQWTTTQEIENETYTIERSEDGVHWLFLQSVSPNDSKAYAVLDVNPLIGLSYYRLRQKDLDGQMNDLGTVSIRFLSTNKPTISPNPSSDIIQVEFQTTVSNLELAIYDNLGRLLLTQKGNQMNISDLPKGNYNLVIQLDNHVWHERFIKN